MCETKTNFNVIKLEHIEDSNYLYIGINTSAHSLGIDGRGYKSSLYRLVAGVSDGWTDDMGECSSRSTAPSG